MKKLGLNDILETQRCILKIPEESEAEYMWSLITEDTTKYMIWEKWENHSDTLKNIKKTREKAEIWASWEWAIYDKKSWICIGRCGINEIIDEILSFQLGYWIAEEYYGQWIVPECVNKYLEFAFWESDFKKWILKCDSRNVNSEKVALKCWFSYEWTLKYDKRFNWKLRDSKYFWITREEYLWKKK